MLSAAQQIPARADAEHGGQRGLRSAAAHLVQQRGEPAGASGALEATVRCRWVNYTFTRRIQTVNDRLMLA